MLLWIDSSDNDPPTVKSIKELYPTLKIDFTPTFTKAKRYLEDNVRDINGRKFLVICRGYYADESKNFNDVAKLLEGFNLGTIQHGVYTGDKKKLLKKTPSSSRNIEIFDKNLDLLSFLKKSLEN